MMKRKSQSFRVELPLTKGSLKSLVFDEDGLLNSSFWRSLFWPWKGLGFKSDFLFNVILMLYSVLWFHSYWWFCWLLYRLFLRPLFPNVTDIKKSGNSLAWVSCSGLRFSYWLICVIVFFREKSRDDMLAVVRDRKVSK